MLGLWTEERLHSRKICRCGEKWGRVALFGVEGGTGTCVQYGAVQTDGGNCHAQGLSKDELKSVLPHGIHVCMRNGFVSDTARVVCVCLVHGGWTGHTRALHCVPTILEVHVPKQHGPKCCLSISQRGCDPARLR